MRSKKVSEGKGDGGDAVKNGPGSPLVSFPKTEKDTAAIPIAPPHEPECLHGQIRDELDGGGVHPCTCDAEVPEPLRAISEGVMEVEGYKIRTFVLNNGERVVDATDAENVMRAMGLM